MDSFAVNTDSSFSLKQRGSASQRESVWRSDCILQSLLFQVQYEQSKQEIADLKESHALGISNIQQKLNQERTIMEKSLREQIAAKVI